MSDNWNSWHEETETGNREPQIPIEPIDTSLANEREGLPRNFRMRADRHYIDQLTAPSAGQPVRMLPVDRIAADPTDADVRPLIDSIRRVGITHPLIVRRRETAYVLVAGRKRLAAARAAGLGTVPCLVHDATEADLAALASADNLTVRVGGEQPERRNVAAGLRIVERHLSKVRRYAEILSDDSTAVDRPTFDLLQAHAWRATLVADGVSLIERAPFPGHRERTIRSIVDELIDRFACECRVTSVTIRPDVRDELSSSGLNDRELLAGLGGAVMSMLPLVADAIRPTLVVHAANSETGGMVLDVEGDVAPSRHTVAAFFDDDPATARPGGYEAAVGALAARALAERHGGTASFEAVDGGSRLTLVLMRRS